MSKSDTKKINFGDLVKKFFKSSLALPICALIIVIILSAIVTKIKYGANFFSINIKNVGLEGETKYVLYGYIIDILNRASELVILAVGMTLVVAASKGTDISVGSVMAIAAAITVRLLGESYDSYAMLPFFAILLGILGAVACGAFNGLLVAKFKIQPMVATLILYTAGRGIAQLISSRPIEGTGKYATGVILYIRKESFRWIGGFLPHNIIPTPIYIAVVFVIIASLFLRFTAFSTYVKTVGINDRAGRLVGINSVLVIFSTYVISGLCSGVAGVISASRIYSSDANNIGLNLELDAILAVALGGNSLGGGKFNLLGSIIGAITIQALTTSLYAIGVPANQLPVYKAIVVILIVLFQSPVFKAALNRAKNRRLSKKNQSAVVHA
ncbi:MAG: ABC transporter permease [Treponema sp.]|nr:ABC transporter permease [Spirochaetia bacterium]MDY2838940.1 ABC transporter permease [Treponema sp.]MDY5122986.1 ABC transporter permease [Treponema sp.]